MSLLNEAFSEIKEKKWIFALVFVAILIGLLLRAYHVDYPVVGYHNWKETHYLTEARNFARDGFFKYGFFVPTYNYPQLTSDPSGAHADTFPFISVVIAIFFKIFGPGLTVARAVNIFFNILIVPAMFLLVRRLFKRNDIALVSAFITSFNPLLVFFSHNTQLQNPGLLFMVLAGYFYVRWFENDLDLDLILTSVFVALSGLTVFTFLVILFPIVLTFPYDRIKRFTFARLKTYAISAAILSTVLLWVLYMKYVVIPRTGISTISEKLLNLAPLYTGQFWQAIRAYAADNYTLFGVVLTFIGIFAFIAYYFREKGMFGKNIAVPLIIATLVVVLLIAWKAQFKILYMIIFAVLAILALPIFKREISSESNSFAFKFMLSYGIGAALFFLLLAEKLSGHSYHQYPIAPFFIIAMSFAIISIGENIGSILSAKVQHAESEEKIGKEDIFKILKYFVAFILVILLIYGPPGGTGKFSTTALGTELALSGSLEAKNRQFDTQFPGPDIAGEYIEKNSAPTDRILFSGGEIMGLLWHSDRKGFYGITSVDIIKEAEEKGVKWVLIYAPLGRNELNNQEVRSYLEGNYGLKQISFVRSGEGTFNVIYLLLKKGGTFDPENLSALVQNYPVASKDYELTGGRRITLGYITLDNKTSS